LIHISNKTGEPIGRISKETMEKAFEQLKTISETDYAKVKGMVNVVRLLNKNGSQRRTLAPIHFGVSGRWAIGPDSVP
jgi:hypothetical protein